MANLTLRYHGKYPSVFERVGGVAWQHDPYMICKTLPAICMRISVGECVKTPDGFASVWNFVIDNGQAQTRYVEETFGSYRSYLPEVSGGFMMLSQHPPVEINRMTDHAKPWIGRSLQTTNSSQDLVLWMGCDASCASCQNYSGRALVLPFLQQNCLATKQRGVLDVSIGDGGLSDCVPSLGAVYAERDPSEVFPAWAAIVSLLVCLLALACLCVFVFQRYRQRCPNSSVVEDHVGTDRAPAVQVVGAQDIDLNFPSLSLEHEPLCAICLQLVMIEEDGRRLQCGHDFHASCITTWWLRNESGRVQCPTCRHLQVLNKSQGFV